MAELKTEVKISVEEVVHIAIRGVLQEVFDTYGLCIKGIRAEWIDVSTHDKDSLFISELEMETLTKR